MSMKIDEINEIQRQLSHQMNGAAQADAQDQLYELQDDYHILELEKEIIDKSLANAKIEEL